MNYQQQPNFQGQAGSYQQQPNFQQPMAAGGPRPEFRQCFKCNYEAVTAAGPCPRCRCPKFLTAGSIRTRGGVMIALGLFIAAFIGGIAIVVGLMLYGEAMKNPATAKKLSSESHVFLVVAMIFGAVIAFGVHGVVSGMWMLAFGKRNRLTVWVMWFLLGLVFVLGAVFRFLT